MIKNHIKKYISRKSILVLQYNRSGLVTKDDGKPCEFNCEKEWINDGNNLKVIKSLSEFKKVSSIILANRMADELLDVTNKVYTRDLFRSN